MAYTHGPADWHDDPVVDAGHDSLDGDDSARDSNDGASETSSECYRASESDGNASTEETSSEDQVEDRTECCEVRSLHAGEDDLHADEDAEILQSTRHRTTIVLLSALLAMLLLNFGYQLSRLFQASHSGADPPRSNVEPAHDHVEMDGDHEKNVRSRREKKVRANDDDAEYSLPKYPSRIYTHSSLSSKNYRAGGVLSDDMLRRYEEDGALVIRNLLSPKLIARVQAASAMLVERQEGASTKKKRGKQFHMLKHGAIFLGVPPPHNDTACEAASGEETCDVEADSGDDADTVLSSFRDLAMYSKIPRVAASLLRLDELRAGGAQNLQFSRREKIRQSQGESGRRVDESINLRICRDIFITKDDDPYACGWHVDDVGFWPAVAHAPGVNAWVALDDMPWPWSGAAPQRVPPDAAPGPVATLALSLGSHRAPWRERAYRVTGSAHTNPAEGYASAADLIQRRTGSGTCNIQTSAPDLYEKLEEKKVLYDLKKGDVVFHDRWLFHRTVTMDEYGKMTRGRDSDPARSDEIFRRYSIRYAPGTAVVPPGYGVELSVLHDPDNANRTLDAIVARSGPWYPQAWPHALKRKPPERAGEEAAGRDSEEGIAGLGKLVHEDLPAAEGRQKERKKEIQRLLSRRGGQL